MSRFVPVTIRFENCGSMVVSNIADAKKALGRTWKNKEDAAYLEAVRLVDAAMAGLCRPAVALAAFRQVAARQNMLKTSDPSAALAMLDALWFGSGTPPP